MTEDGLMKQGKLSKKIGYSPGGITHIATKLITEDFAIREYDEKDRHIIKLAISDIGLLQQAEKTGKNIYSVLNEDEMKQ